MISVEGLNKFLVFQNIPKTVLFGCPTDISIVLIDANKNILPEDNIPIEIQIFKEHDILHECPASTMMISSSTNSLMQQGMITFQITVQNVPENHKNQKFLFRISSPYPEIMPCYSNTITCYKYRLVFETESPFNPWFKDENRQDRYLDYRLVLVNANNEVIHDKYFLIEAAVYYENGSPVPLQSIMSLHIDSNMYINELGRASVRFRINDVSKNHQKQRFCLVVSCKPSPESEFVAPAISQPLEVRSKRTKRPSEEPFNSGSTFLINKITLLIHSRRDKRAKIGCNR